MSVLRHRQQLSQDNVLFIILCYRGSFKFYYWASHVAPLFIHYLTWFENATFGGIFIHIGIVKSLKFRLDIHQYSLKYRKWFPVLDDSSVVQTISFSDRPGLAFCLICSGFLKKWCHLWAEEKSDEPQNNDATDTGSEEETVRLKLIDSQAVLAVTDTELLLHGHGSQHSATSYSKAKLIR